MWSRLLIAAVVLLVLWPWSAHAQNVPKPAEYKAFTFPGCAGLTTEFGFIPDCYDTTQNDAHYVWSISEAHYVPAPQAQFTVATLPVCSTTTPSFGSVAGVTDNLNNCATLTGGGTNFCPVFCNGSTWNLFGNGGGGGGGGGLNSVSAGAPLSAVTNNGSVFLTITSPLPKASGGTGTTTPGETASTGLSVNGTWPNQQFLLMTPVSILLGGTGTSTPGETATNGITVSGVWPNQQFSLTSPVTAANGGTGVQSPPAHAIPIAEGAGSFAFLNCGASLFLAGVAGTDPSCRQIVSGDISQALQTPPNIGTGVPAQGIFSTLVDSGMAGGPLCVHETNGVLSATAADCSASGGGTITAVNPGTGLSGGGNSGSVSLSLLTPVSVANGGTGTGSPGLTAGNGLSVSGGFPFQQFSLVTPVSVANGGTGTNSPGLTASTGLSVSGAFPFQQFALQVPVSIANGGNGTNTPGIVGGNGITISGNWPFQQVALTSPVTVSNGGTGCNGAKTVATLPGSPVIGQTCTVTDASGCSANATAITGGGSVACQVVWLGSAWVPAGGAIASGGGGGTITSVNPGTGLSGGGSSGSVTLSLQTPVSILLGGTGTTTPGESVGTGLAVSGSWPNQQFSLVTPISKVNGGTGTSTPGETVGTGLSVSGTWPTQQFSLLTPVSIANGGTGTGTPGLTAGTGLSVSGTFPTQQFSLISPVTVANGGTGATSFTANNPLIGGNPVAQGTRSGNTTVFGTTSGTLTSGDCVKFDANGNLVDVGAPCGTGGSGTISGVTAGTGLTGGGTSGTVTLNLSTPVSVANGGTGTGSPGTIAGTGITTTGNFPTQTVALTTPVNSTNGGTGVSNPASHGIIIGEGSGAMSAVTCANNLFLAGVTGSDPACRALTGGDLTVALGSPPPIGGTAPNTGAFSSLSDSGLASGQCVQTSSGGLLSVTGGPCGGAPLVVHAATGTPVNSTCSSQAVVDHYNQTLAANTTFVLPPNTAGCLDGQVVEWNPTQSQGNGFTATISPGTGTTLAIDVPGGSIPPMPSNALGIATALYQAKFDLPNLKWHVYFAGTFPATRAAVLNGDAAGGVLGGRTGDTSTYPAPALMYDPITLVANLPTCDSGHQGKRYDVTDCTICAGGVTCTGSGTVYCPQVCSGTAWIGLGAGSIVTTVATLPVIPFKSERADVTDCTTCVFGATCVGGGSTYCAELFNGTAWIAY